MADGVNKTWIVAINSAISGNKKSVSVHIIPLQIQKPTEREAYCSPYVRGTDVPMANSKYVYYIHQSNYCSGEGIQSSLGLE